MSKANRKINPPKYVYLVKEKVLLKEGSLTEMTQAAYESEYDAFAHALMVVNDDEDQRFVNWRFVLEHDEDRFSDTIAIEGQGEFRSFHNLSDCEFYEGIKRILITRIRVQEAKNYEHSMGSSVSDPE